MESVRQLLKLPLAELESRYTRAEKLGSVEGLFRIDSHSYLFVQKQSLHLVHPGNGGLESVGRLVLEVRKRDLPLSIVFLLSSQESWSGNLSYLRELARLNPSQFGFKLLTHPRNECLSYEGHSATFPSREEFIKLGGRRYLVLQVPGHRLGGDQLALLEIDAGLLFVADLLQPHGEAYEYCSFLTPVPDHHDPEAAMASLQLLRTLPFEWVLCGHEQMMDRSRGYIWIRVTQKVLERLAFHCRKVLWEEDCKDLMGNARNVYLKLAIERNLSLDPLYLRFEPQADGSSLFVRHDLPAIAFYLRKFGGDDS